MIIYKHIAESTEDESVFNGRVEIEVASKEEWKALMAALLPNAEIVDCDTICRCNVKRNAEAIAQILDYDIRGEECPYEFTGEAGRECG